MAAQSRQMKHQVMEDMICSKKIHYEYSWVVSPQLIVSFISLKSVNSKFTLAVHSPKFGQAKNHFLSHHYVYYINIFANFLTSDQWSNG